MRERERALLREQANSPPTPFPFFSPRVERQGKEETRLCNVSEERNESWITQSYRLGACAIFQTSAAACAPLQEDKRNTTTMQGDTDKIVICSSKRPRRDRRRVLCAQKACGERHRGWGKIEVPDPFLSALNDCDRVLQIQPREAERNDGSEAANSLGTDMGSPRLRSWEGDVCGGKTRRDSCRKNMHTPE